MISRSVTFFVAAACVMSMSPIASGQVQGTHYPNGVEGIKGASIPGPGLYIRMYNLYYMADDLKDASGHDSPVGLEVSSYVLAPRVLWVSETEVLGGNFFVSALLPVVYTDIEITPPKGAPVPKISKSDWGIGDLYVDAADIAWHGKQWDAAAGVGFFAPTGEYNVNDPSSAGKDMWTGMGTLGGTYFPDVERTWSVSVLSRYETHTEQDKLDVTPGDDFHFEWGVGKSVMPCLDVGLAGYCQWQVTDDEGSDVTWDKSDHDQVFAAGPEIAGVIPQIQTVASLRTLWEFEARDRPQGFLASLTLTRRF